MVVMMMMVMAVVCHLPGESRNIVSDIVMVGMYELALWCSGKGWNVNIFGHILILNVGMASVGAGIIGGCLGGCSRT